MPLFFNLSSVDLALDLRALQAELVEGLQKIATEEIVHTFAAPHISASELSLITSKVCRTMVDTLDSTSTMDAAERMQKVAASSTTVLLDFFTGPGFTDRLSAGFALTCIPAFRANVTSRAIGLIEQLRQDYLTGARGAAPASSYLNKTRPVYEFVRLTLGIRMHGSENLHDFENGLGVEDVTVGQNVSLIHEVRDPFYFLLAFRVADRVHHIIGYS